MVGDVKLKGMTRLVGRQFVSFFLPNGFIRRGKEMSRKYDLMRFLFELV